LGITVVGIVTSQASFASPNGVSWVGVAVKDTSTASLSILISLASSGSIGGLVGGNPGGVPGVLVVPVPVMGFAISQPPSKTEITSVLSIISERARNLPATKLLIA
jgi:hypothetical protein